MFGFGGGRRREETRETPPVVVPDDAIRPGEDDAALVRANAHYVRAMRKGTYAFHELNADAAAAHAVDGYLARVEQGGHAAYMADPPSPGMLARCQDGLDRLAPKTLAPLHAAVISALEDSAEGEAPEIDTDPLDAAFREGGGRAAVDPLLAGMIARIEGLEVVQAAAYSGRLTEVATAHPEAALRRRDLWIAEIESALTSHLQAGVAVILARTTGRCLPFALKPLPPSGDGLVGEGWAVETADEDFRTAMYPDRLVVFRARPDGKGWTGLGHLAHEKIELSCAWAAQAHVALASVTGLERIGAEGRLRMVVFDRRKVLKQSGADAAAFHLSLEGMPDLALVVFPRLCAVVDPRTNERLAEIEHEMLREEAIAHAERMAALAD